MELLSKLTPAETFMLLKPTDSRLSDLMKFTFMDLLARQVLQMPNFDKKPVQGEATLGFAYVIIGRNFKREVPKLHEMIFLFPFYKKQNAKVRFRHLMQMAFSRAKNEEKFKLKFILDSPDMKPLITIGFWQKLFGSFALTEEGKKRQAEIVRYFNQLDKDLPLLMKNNKEEADKYLNEIKGNVILLNAFKFELLHVIGKEITELEKQLEEG